MDTNLQHNLIANIHTLLESTGMTQHKLAAKVGMHHCTLSRILNGHNVPTLEHCERLARVLKVKPPYLIFGKSVDKETCQTTG